MNDIRSVVYEAVAKDLALKVHAVVMADINTGEILYATGLAEDMFGYDAGDMAGRCVDELLPEGSRTRHAAYRQEYAKSPRPRPMGHGIVLFGRKKDGQAFPVQVSLSASSVLGRGIVVAFVVDLSEPVKTVTRIQALVEQGEAETGPPPPGPPQEVPREKP